MLSCFDVKTYFFLLSFCVCDLSCGCFKLTANVLGAEAVSEFTDKTLFKERMRSFSPKLYSKCEIAYCLCPLLAAGMSAQGVALFLSISRF
jgi:hypothetical protein